jgi:porin
MSTKVIKKNIFILSTASIFGFNLMAENNAKGITLTSSYTGDIAANVAGGLKTGTSYLGRASLSIDLDTRGLGLWNGGRLQFSVLNTHGWRPSQDLAGDLQVLDNIEAGNHTFLSESWYRQEIGNTSISTGLMDINTDYVRSDLAGIFFNSSFGINAVISYNNNPPIFPVTGLGISFAWKINDNCTWSSAIFGGEPKAFDEGNPYNLNYDLRKSRGYLTISEAAYCRNDATVKVGTFYHTGRENWGIYSILEKQLWQTGPRKVSCFAQLAYSPRKTEQITTNIAGGLCCTSPFTKRGNDEIGLAATSIAMPKHQWETAIELSYKYKITGFLSVSPDIQYIVNPASGNIDNALVTTVRIEIGI